MKYIYVNPMKRSASELAAIKDLIRELGSDYRLQVRSEDATMMCVVGDKIVER